MTSDFKWDQFEQISPATSSPSFDWDQFEKLEEKPGILKEVGRHAARTGARIGETLLGFPGDIARTILGLGYAARQGIEKKLGKTFISAPEEEYESLLQTLPPGSQELREITKKWFKEFLEPQSKGESIADTLASDIASLAIPIKGKIPFAKAIGTALGANVASEGAKLVGASEQGQLATKMGATFLLSSFKPNGAKKYADSLYKKAQALVPEGATVPAKQLSKEIGYLNAQLKKGGSAPYKTPAITKLNEIKSKINQGRIPVEELTQFKIDINKARSGLYGDVNLDKGGRAIAKRNLDAAAKIIDNALSEYAQANPTWSKEYRAANEVYGAISQSKKVSNALSRAIGQGNLTKGALLVAEAIFSPKSAVVTAGAYGGLKTGELLARIAKSPTLRKHYIEVVNAALKEDIAIMAKSLAKMDAILKKNTSKEDYQ